ncbi:MAG: TetR/AcrR family transcriptional regulator [Thiohalomonadales bacterium]
MTATNEKDSTDVRFLILEAAQERFVQYGFNKTTMAEIAKDCQMSASNIYRFFPSKLDIAAGLACRCLDEEADALQAVIAKKELSATERLREFIFTLFEETYTKWSEQPRMTETVVAICNERMDIVDQHIHRKHALLTTLLREGVDNNEFMVKDLQVTAEAISTTLTIFDVPMFMPMFTREAFERKAASVFELIVNGVKKH